MVCFIFFFQRKAELTRSEHSSQHWICCYLWQKQFKKSGVTNVIFVYRFEKLISTNNYFCILKKNNLRFRHFPSIRPKTYWVTTTYYNVNAIKSIFHFQFSFLLSKQCVNRDWTDFIAHLLISSSDWLEEWWLLI